MPCNLRNRPDGSRRCKRLLAPAIGRTKRSGPGGNVEQFCFQLSSIAGLALAGGLLHVTNHAAYVYAVNASAALSASLLFVKLRQYHTPTIRQELTIKTLRTGFNMVFTNRIILGIITLDKFAILLGGATALLPIYAKDILLVGPWGWDACKRPCHSAPSAAHL